MPQRRRTNGSGQVIGSPLPDCRFLEWLTSPWDLFLEGYSSFLTARQPAKNRASSLSVMVFLDQTSAKRPFSRRFIKITRPVPSQDSDFARLLSFETNKKTVPDNEFIARTRPYKPSKDLTHIAGLTKDKNVSFHCETPRKIRTTSSRVKP